MRDILEYMGYSGSVEVSLEDNCLHGKILHIRDLVTYEAESLPQLKSEFESAVDDYLQTCERLGVAPKKPCSGTFNVRVGPELHLHAVEAATRKHVSLNDFVKKAISSEIKKTETHQTVHHHYHGTYVVKQVVRETGTIGRHHTDETVTHSRLIFNQGQAVNH